MTKNFCIRKCKKCGREGMHALRIDSWQCTKCGNMIKKRTSAKLNKLLAPQWYQPGFAKDGNARTPRTLPKKQLSEREARVYRILQDRKINTLDQSQEMRKICDIYIQKYPDDDYDRSLCSDNLEKLQQSGFVNMLPARQAKVNKNTEAIRPIRKARFYLSEKANSGALTIDVKRWVILDGQYVASEATRARQEARQNDKVG